MNLVDFFYQETHSRNTKFENSQNCSKRFLLCHIGFHFYDLFIIIENLTFIVLHPTFEKPIRLYHPRSSTFIMDFFDIIIFVCCVYMLTCVLVCVWVKCVICIDKNAEIEVGGARPLLQPMYYNWSLRPYCKPYWYWL